MSQMLFLYFLWIRNEGEAHLKLRGPLMLLLKFSFYSLRPTFLLIKKKKI